VYLAIARNFGGRIDASTTLGKYFSIKYDVEHEFQEF
jgi:hypothetical protein